jgi:hypothetical protein
MTSRFVTKEIFSRRATSERHGRARQLAPPAPVGVEPVDLARHHGCRLESDRDHRRRRLTFSGSCAKLGSAGRISIISLQSKVAVLQLKRI